jgi:DNA-binding transcriptional LysR family regulator
MDETERIERRLKLHDLRVLMSVVEQGSMAKAAERLATSQPAVSRTIADLEHSLSVRFLDRGPRGIVPTPYGRALIKRSVTVFDELRLGVKDLEFLADPTAGEVRIAAPMALAAGLIPAVIDKLTRRHPRVVCHVTVDMTYRALEEREVDLVITQIGAPIDHMEAELLYTDRVFVVAATKNPWSRKRKVNLADLMNEPWTLPPPNMPGMVHAEASRAAGLGLPDIAVVIERYRAHRSCRQGAVSHPHFRICNPVCPQGHGNQGSAHRFAGYSNTSRDRHIEEPHPHAGGAAFHRVRARSSKADGERKIRPGCLRTALGANGF